MKMILCNNRIYILNFHNIENSNSIIDKIFQMVHDYFKEKKKFF